MNLALVGVSHHQAPIELRERVAVDIAGAARAGPRPRRRLRGGRAVHVQPHRDLPGCRRRARSGAPRRRCAARSGGRRGGLAGARRLPPRGRVGGAAPVPGRRRPRLARAGRRGDSRARSETRSKPAGPGRCSTGSSATRCTPAAERASRLPSARARRLFPPPRPRSRSRCSTTLAAARWCSSAPAR